MTALGVTQGYLYGLAGLASGMLAVLALVGMTFVASRDKASTAWSVLPFIWTIVIPAVTVPLHISLLDGATDAACVEVPSSRVDRVWECSPSDVLPTLLPGFLNLVPLLWLLSSEPRVRRAALAAASLGTVRLLVPALFWLVEAPDITIIGSWQFPAASPYNASLVLSPVLWFLSAVGAVVTARPALGRLSIVVIAAAALAAATAVVLAGIQTLLLEP